MAKQTGTIQGLDPHDFTDGMRVELDDTAPEPGKWRRKATATLVGFVAGVVLTCAYIWLAVLMTGCGGDYGGSQYVDDAQSQATIQVTLQGPAILAAEQFEQHWCCRNDPSETVLTCGALVHPDGFALCYCAGVVHLGDDGEECEDTTLYTPGSTCTAAGLVCL